MTVGPDGRPAEGVARSRIAVGGDAQDLAAERPEVLRQGGVAGLARTDVQVAVGPEGDTAAVVVPAAGDAREDDDRFADGAVAPWHCRDAVVALGRVVRVEHGVGVEVARDGEPEEATLSFRAGDGQASGDGGLAPGAGLGHVQDAAGVSLADQGAAVGQHRHRPRDVDATEQGHRRGRVGNGRTGCRGGPRRHGAGSRTPWPGSAPRCSVAARGRALRGRALRGRDPGTRRGSGGLARRARGPDHGDGDAHHEGAPE